MISRLGSMLSVTFIPPLTQDGVADLYPHADDLHSVTVALDEINCEDSGSCTSAKTSKETARKEPVIMYAPFEEI